MSANGYHPWSISAFTPVLLLCSLPASVQMASRLSSLESSQLTSVLLLYSSPAFLDKMSIHVAKNFLDLPKIKIPLILGIWGKPLAACQTLCWRFIPRAWLMFGCGQQWSSIAACFVLCACKDLLNQVCTAQYLTVCL